MVVLSEGWELLTLIEDRQGWPEVVAINDRRITEVKHVKQALSECAGQNVDVLTAREGGLRRCTVTALAAVDHRKVEAATPSIAEDTKRRRVTGKRAADTDRAVLAKLNDADQWLTAARRDADQLRLDKEKLVRDSNYIN